MTVVVTLPDGRVDEYMRFGDSYVEHDNGTLDVIRTGTGAKLSFSYAAGEWTGVEGDEKRWKKFRLWPRSRPS